MSDSEEEVAQVLALLDLQACDVQGYQFEPRVQGSTGPSPCDDSSTSDTSDEETDKGPQPFNIETYHKERLGNTDWYA